MLGSQHLPVSQCQLLELGRFQIPAISFIQVTLRLQPGPLRMHSVNRGVHVLQILPAPSWACVTAFRASGKSLGLCVSDSATFLLPLLQKKEGWHCSITPDSFLQQAAFLLHPTLGAPALAPHVVGLRMAAWRALQGLFRSEDSGHFRKAKLSKGSRALQLLSWRPLNSRSMGYWRFRFLILGRPSL